MSAMKFRSLLPLVLLATLLGACGGGGGGPSGPASIAGSIDFQSAGSMPHLQAGSGTLDSALVQGLAQPGARLSFRVQDGDALHALSFVAREGLHVPAVTYPWVQRMPPPARASIFGVGMPVPP